MRHQETRDFQSLGGQPGLTREPKTRPHWTMDLWPNLAPGSAGPFSLPVSSTCAWSSQAKMLGMVLLICKYIYILIIYYVGTFLYLKVIMKNYFCWYTQSCTNIGEHWSCCIDHLLIIIITIFLHRHLSSFIDWKSQRIRLFHTLSKFLLRKHT